jgi:hypothetical protein
MNNKLNIELFFNLKNNEDCLYLDNDIIDSIIDTFTNNNSKHKKNKIILKKSIAVIKNPKLKQIKDKISNKVNLILNKISENNIENLVIEFIENIKILNIDDYNEFIRSFYIKLLSEINFFKFYIKFFNIITLTYNKVNNYKIDYFYNLIESKFNFDYYDEINNETEIFKEMNDEKRINNLILINNLIKVNYFNEEFISYINNKILNQRKYVSDIYYWLKDIELTKYHIENINSILSEDIQLRDRVLLDNLLNGSNNIELCQSFNKIIFKNPQPYLSQEIINEVSDKKYIETKINNNLTELENNLEEYIFINNSESIEDYINNNCKDAAKKNKFCEFIIDKYFKLQHLDSQKILLLMKKLIKSKILFKSNLSRGLLNLYNNKNNYNQEKFKNILLFLKNIGITNGLEPLMNKYKIEININY